MEEQRLQGLARRMRDQRERIFTEVADTEDDLRWFAEDRESELEERAQEERAARLLARLDDRGKQEIEEIDEALRRISAGSYGICEGCAERIPFARLATLPATRLCVDCARADENAAPGYAPSVSERALRHPARLPADLSALSDPELEASLRELVREDGRIDTEELRIVCRHGIVQLEGSLPSEAEHGILRGLIQDVAGLQEIADRLQIQEVLWEREQRGKNAVASGARSRAGELEVGTEDVVESIEEGVNYTPPGAPIEEEEE